MQEPNFCNKHKSTVSLINSYMKLVEALEAEGVDHETAYAKVPEGAARHIFGYGKEQYDARVKAIAQGIKDGLNDSHLKHVIEVGARALTDYETFEEGPEPNTGRFVEIRKTLNKQNKADEVTWDFCTIEESLSKVTVKALNQMSPETKESTMVLLHRIAKHVQELLDSQMAVVEDCGCAVKDMSLNAGEVIDADFAFVNPAPEKKSTTCEFFYKEVPPEPEPTEGEKWAPVQKTVEQAYSEKQNAVMFAIEAAAKLHMENKHFLEMGGKRSDTGEASGLVKHQEAFKALVDVLDLIHGAGKWGIPERKAMEKRVAASAGAMWKRFQKAKTVMVKKEVEKATPLHAACFRAAVAHVRVNMTYDKYPGDGEIPKECRDAEDAYYALNDEALQEAYPGRCLADLTDEEVDVVNDMVEALEERAIEHIKKWG